MRFIIEKEGITPRSEGAILVKHVDTITVKNIEIPLYVLSNVESPGEVNKTPAIKLEYLSLFGEDPHATSK